MVQGRCEAPFGFEFTPQLCEPACNPHPYLDHSDFSSIRIDSDLILGSVPHYETLGIRLLPLWSVEKLVFLGHS